jgi:cholesterol transport system auxiliary component
MRMSLTRLAPFALATVLSGCAGLQTLQNVTKPVDLYDLTPKSTFASDLPEVKWQVVVEEPTAASSVNTDRIAVKPNAFVVKYFPEARWVDRAPLLVQTLLVESFENTGKVTSVGRRVIGLSSDFTLISELREFQAEVGGGENAPFSIRVQLNMKIVKEPDGLIVASKNFGREVESASDDMLDVVAAFDVALGKAMRDSVEWTVREVARIGGESRGW